MASVKGPGAAQAHDGSALRIAIVHARWNTTIIDPLVAGVRKSLAAAGVKDENIVTQSVPGSYELPFAVQRFVISPIPPSPQPSPIPKPPSVPHDVHPLTANGKTSHPWYSIYAASQVQSSTTSTLSAGDLLSNMPSLTDLTTAASAAPAPSHSSPSPSAASTAPFDALVAIGVLIKGETMHFEYIAEATSHGLMRVQLDGGVPVVFGLLTVLSEEQARARAGIGSGGGHNHGEDWGSAAVELGVKRREWGRGKMV